MPKSKEKVIKRKLPCPSEKALRTGAIIEDKWYRIEIFKDGQWQDAGDDSADDEELKYVRREAKGIGYAMEKVRIMEHFHGKQPTGIEYDDR